MRRYRRIGHAASESGCRGETGLVPSEGEKTVLILSPESEIKPVNLGAELDVIDVDALITERGGAAKSLANHLHSTKVRSRVRPGTPEPGAKELGAREVLVTSASIAGDHERDDGGPHPKDTTDCRLSDDEARAVDVGSSAGGDGTDRARSGAVNDRATGEISALKELSGGIEQVEAFLGDTVLAGKGTGYRRREVERRFEVVHEDQPFGAGVERVGSERERSEYVNHDSDTADPVTAIVADELELHDESLHHEGGMCTERLTRARERKPRKPSSPSRFPIYAPERLPQRWGPRRPARTPRQAHRRLRSGL